MAGEPFKRVWSDDELFKRAGLEAETRMDKNGQVAVRFKKPKKGAGSAAATAGSPPPPPPASRKPPTGERRREWADWEREAWAAKEAAQVAEAAEFPTPITVRTDHRGLSPQTSEPEQQMSQVTEKMLAKEKKMKEERHEAERLEPTGGPRSAEDAHEPIYDPESQGYREVLREKLKAQRPTRYAHLPGSWFQQLVATLLIGSAALWVEGCPPGRIRDFVFDLEPKPGRSGQGCFSRRSSGPATRRGSVTTCGGTRAWVTSSCRRGTRSAT